MTIRVKVLLFAAVAVGLVAWMGYFLYVGSSHMYLGRIKLEAIHEQLALYGRMQSEAWSYLEALREARQAGRDTGALLRAEEQRIQGAAQGLEERFAQEQRWKSVPVDPEEPRRIAEVRQALLQWAARMEQELQAVPPGTPLPPETWWRLFATFDAGPGPAISRAVEAERRDLELLRGQWDRGAWQGQATGVVLPLVALLVLGALAPLILIPLHRSLRHLLASAERIGRADFEGELPTKRDDELGKLARAFHRMAGELKETLEEKQRLLKAEAETAEREFRRYNALLEDTVRTRTAELEKANAQLAESLEQLKAAQAKLLYADRLAIVGQLAAGVGHEINNPLAYVISNLSYVHKSLTQVRDIQSEEEWEELRTVIIEARQGAERVKAIVQDLKALARADESSSGPVELAAVVHTAVNMVSHEFRARARVVEDCASVPPVQGNAARLGQVFLNLLLNAAQAIPRGNEGANEIRLVARVETPGQVIVEVSDTGQGIPEEYLARIFDPFFTTKAVGEGTGLGLSVCHSIITELQGSISVSSKVGGGTTFRIVLPVAEGLYPVSHH